MDPAVDRGVINRHAPLGHHFLQIAVAHPVAAVPPHCPQNNVTGEMTTGEDAHGSDYFTSLCLLPQLCNSTLGINPETLRNWVVQAEVDEGHRPGTTTSESQRLVELEKEVRELRRANSILRSASAFFAAELDRPQR